MSSACMLHSGQTQKPHATSGFRCLEVIGRECKTFVRKRYKKSSAKPNYERVRVRVRVGIRVNNYQIPYAPPYKFSVSLVYWTISKM